MAMALLSAWPHALPALAPAAARGRADAGTPLRTSARTEGVASRTWSHKNRRCAGQRGAEHSMPKGMRQPVPATRIKATGDSWADASALVQLHSNCDSPNATTVLETQVAFLRASAPAQAPPDSPQPARGIHVSRRDALRAALLLPALGVPLGNPYPVLGAPAALEEDVATRVYEVSTPSVAAILLFKTSSRDPEGELLGTGSGVVWDKYGHIVTNYHVIASAMDDSSGVKCTVKLLQPGGGMVGLAGRVIGIDPTRDLAVLKVEDAMPEELSPAAIGDSGTLRVGQSCFAVGNPYGYLHTLTSGVSVVSGLGRAIPSPAGQAIPGAIQTDAAINSGNSGGPLLDSVGRVVGINTATFTRTGSGTSSGVNFALPIDTVTRVVPQLIVYGTLNRAFNSIKS